MPRTSQPPPSMVPAARPPLSAPRHAMPHPLPRNLHCNLPRNLPRNLHRTPPPFPQDFSSVAEKTGTYTAMDYADIMDHLIVRWDVPGRQHLSGDAAAAQEYLIKLPNRIRRLAEKAAGGWMEEGDVRRLPRAAWAPAGTLHAGPLCAGAQTVEQRGCPPCPCLEVMMFCAVQLRPDPHRIALELTRTAPPRPACNACPAPPQPARPRRRWCTRRSAGCLTARSPSTREGWR